MDISIDLASDLLPLKAPKAEAEPHAPRRLAPLSYCLLLVCLPLLSIPALIALGSSDFFLHHGASVWVQANDKVFDTSHRQCDVLVYGDSTAMTGIDPDRVEEQTGLKTCNIAVTNAVLAVTGNLTLDHFLTNNPKPKVLLIQLSPDGFQPESSVWSHTVYAEGMLELLRHGTPGEVRHLLLKHPAESAAFAGYAAGYTAWYVVKNVWYHATSLRPEEDRISVRNGFFTPPSPALTSCETSPSIVSATNSQQIAFSHSIVANYRNGYSDRAGLVLVNVAPIPECDQNLAAYTAELDGITSNSLLPLPLEYFNSCCHYTALGSKILSTLISGELNKAANGNSTIHDHTPHTRPVATLHRIRLPMKR